MSEHQSVVPHDAWIEARQQLLAKEKAFNRLRDELSAERRALPWERVDKAYVFDGRSGRKVAGRSVRWAVAACGVSLHAWARLEGRLQELFLLGPTTSMVSMSISHIGMSRFLAVSSAPLARIEAFRRPWLELQ